MTHTHSARDAAMMVVETLRAGGHAALFAGGCVRDTLLGLAPKDYDVVTDATPEQVHDILPNSRRVGAKFGVMLVRRVGHDIEVATFRTEGPYSDGRRPDTVTFATAREDARRRDFTINGLFFDPIEGRVIDYVGGRRDLDAGVLRTIGDADARFGEDHLRMLRAIRFAARLGFAIDPATLCAMKRHADKLPSISAERVWMELEMIITAPTRTRGWSLLVESGLRRYLAWAWPPDADADRGVSARFDALPSDRIDASLAVAAMLHNQTPAAASEIGRALRFSNGLRARVVWLLGSVSRLTATPSATQADALELADLKTLMQHREWDNLLELLRADLLAAGADTGCWDVLRSRAAAIPRHRVAPPPLLSGDDLTAMGLAPGPLFGAILGAVRRRQLNEEIHTREDAVRIAQEMA